jgi:N-acetylglutamate synthase-like GNAT family acetyltransferase
MEDEMSETVSIRFGGIADLAFIRQGQDLSPEVLRRKIDWQEIVVAERHGALVGYLLVEYLWSRLPYIALIWVQPECRRQGIGKAMLGYLEAGLRCGGHATLYSSSQADEAEPQAWHRHVGFEECGVIAGINQGGVGELFFRKWL